ncbi:hypothetical protein [Neorhizobium sp. P12A]|uniref:hypothetical protein n=1 Tax=Neorhizobium sp. P12A TaxID=2268027 RepID=UPI0011EF0B06|nr:hypothetical protein [Neorhizobium sp. P12A]
MRKLLSSIAALAFVAAAMATPALASSGSWNSSGTEPSIFQSNFWYSASPIAALAGTPSTALVSTVTFSGGYTAPPFNPNNPSYTLNTIACVATVGSNAGKCGQVVGASDSNDTFWSGKSATASWTFEYNAVSSTTKTFVSSPTPSSLIHLSVNYTF